MTPQLAPSPKVLEDPLAHLPCSSIGDYRKGQTIYSRQQNSNSLYLVIDGKVKVCRPVDKREVVVDIYVPDEFFGEAALLDIQERTEMAVAIENVKVMSWTAAEIEDIASRRPKLAIALFQLMAQRSIDLTIRIESLSVDNIQRRLARTLIRFAERFGQGTGDDGSVQMMALTHELLSEYVGTSREIITHYMNEFRRNGYLNYSRKGILLRSDALTDWLRQNHSIAAAA